MDSYATHREDAATHAVIVEGLGRSFGEVTALRGVDFRLPRRRVLGLLGPNGAGKTTAIRILSTLLRPDRGRAWVAGFDVIAEPRQVRRVVGLSGQNAAVDDYLTGRENLHMMARLSKMSRGDSRRRADHLIELFDLTGAAERMVNTYSGGMRRRLDVAAGLVADPQVLFLDEPTTGLDPHSRAGVWHLVEEMVRSGTSVLLTTQYLEEADRLAHDIVVIDEGSVIAEGTPEQLKSDVGGDRLEIFPERSETLDQLGEVVKGFGSGPLSLDRELGCVILPVTHGPGILGEVAMRISEAGISIRDLALRRPTLDDVFLALTGASRNE